MYWTALATKTGALAVESKDVVEVNAICFDETLWTAANIWVTKVVGDASTGASPVP